MSRDDEECLRDALDHLRILKLHLAEQGRDDQVVIDGASLRLSAAIDSVAMVSDDRRRVGIDDASWRTIKSMRNRIVHAYGFMDPAVLRQTFDEDIADFEQDIRRALREGGSGRAREA